MLRECGVNRLSIGVQSFNDHELQVLGRTHCADKSIQSLEDAHEAGFDNISLDLMYGLPGQALESWRANLEQAVKLQPHHLSLYQLSIEEGTGFHDQYRAGRMVLPDDEEILGMEQFTREYLGSHGIEQYEISNYARPGYECRHNIGYWENEEFVGCGAGAAGFCSGRRYKVITDPLRYCLAVECGGNVVEEDEILDTEASFRETVVMGLRLLRGVDKKRLFERFGVRLDDQYGMVLNELVGIGLLEENNDYLRLTARGRRYANQVMAELV
jgi:oxygen-independent coproporphyrinogen-3 oxidase